MVMIRLISCMTLLAAVTLLAGCDQGSKATNKAPEASKAKATAEQTKEAPTAASAEKTGAKATGEKKEAETKDEIVFDPRTPPPGYVNCHRNHCHKVGGGIASYEQVMAEMGATKIVGVPKRAPIPPAPADVAAPPADAVVTKSGLAYKILKAGDGDNKPSKESVVVVHYTGWTADGKGFDSSVSRGKPAMIPLNKMFPGWVEGLTSMSIGEEKRLWIPQELAFNGQPGRPQGMLVFDVELLEIK